MLKKFLKTLVISVCVLFTQSASFSQEIANSGIEKVNTLNASAKRYLIKPDSLLHYSNLALQLSKTIDYKQGEATASKFLGIKITGLALKEM